MLTVIETHPVQYHAPVYRCVQERYDLPVTVVYGSDFSVAGYKDTEFGSSFAWDTDLLSGYSSHFLSRVFQGGPASYEGVSARGLRGALRDIRSRAFLLSGYNSKFYRSVFWKVKGHGLPILFRGETTDHALARNPLKAWLRRSLLRRFYGMCSKLLYIGRRSYEHYKNMDCSEGKLVFSPYCVDTGPFQLGERARHALRAPARLECGVGEGDIMLLFSGKLSFRKGPDLILQAVKELDAHIREQVVVVFLGSGAMEGELRNAAHTEPAVRVNFLGFKNQKTLSRYYHAADLLALPSRYSETWGLVVNDALHHELPCVVSDGVGCAPDLIEEGVTGEIFLNSSAQALAAALRRALGLINRAEVRESCRRKVSGYTVEMAAKGVAEAYYEATS